MPVLPRVDRTVRTVSRLQVVRVAYLAARVGRDAAVPALLGAASIATKVFARLSARWIEGYLHLFLCAVAGALRWLLWLLWLFFSTFTPAITSVACFSFLTLGEQGDSSFTVAEARVNTLWASMLCCGMWRVGQCHARRCQVLDILHEFRALAGIRRVVCRVQYPYLGCCL